MTQGERDHQWNIEVVGSHDGPMTLRLRCTEATPIYVIRSALALQLDS